MTRKFIVGGNFKVRPFFLVIPPIDIQLNGSKASLKTLIEGLDEASVDPNAEIVIAPPFVYIDSARKSLRKDVTVAGWPELLPEGQRCLHW
ncbi:triosephosphate isomerase [Mortierella antarctica]|nr:triosephosphate isomerase [Mortierella antarctica]